MVLLGETGFRAAEGHAPLVGGRERYVFFVLPHIALGEGGEPGLSKRPGRPEPALACGALAALESELVQGPLRLELEPYDLEYSLLKRRLAGFIPPGDHPDLVRLTYLAHQAALADLETMIERTVDSEAADYAVLSGIQIHTPGPGYIWPGQAYLLTAGRLQDLVW
jgi:hypothetical protein